MKREQTRWGAVLLLALCAGCATGTNERMVMRSRAQSAGGGGILASRARGDSTRTPDAMGRMRGSVIAGSTTDERLVRYFPALKQQTIEPATSGNGTAGNALASGGPRPRMGAGYEAPDESTVRTAEDEGEPSSVLPAALPINLPSSPATASAAPEPSKRDGSVLARVAALPALDQSEPGVITTSAEVVQDPLTVDPSPKITTAFPAPPPPSINPSLEDTPAQVPVFSFAERDPAITSPPVQSNTTAPPSGQAPAVVVLPTTQVQPAPQSCPPVPSKQMPRCTPLPSPQSAPKPCALCCWKDKMSCLKTKLCCLKPPPCHLKEKICTAKSQFCGWWKQKNCCLKKWMSPPACTATPQSPPTTPSSQVFLGRNTPAAAAAAPLMSQNAPSNPSGGTRGVASVPAVAPGSTSAEYHAAVAAGVTPLFPKTYYSVPASSIAQSTAATNPVPAPVLPPAMGASPEARPVAAHYVASATPQPEKKKRTPIVVRLWNRLHGREADEPEGETASEAIARRSGDPVPYNFPQRGEPIQRVSTDSINETPQR